MASRTRIIEVVSAGPQGPVGKSAYEIAVEEGFVGTQTDWLEKLSKPYAGMLGTKLASEVVEVQIDYSDILEDGEQCLNVDQIQSTPCGQASALFHWLAIRFDSSYRAEK